MKHVDNEHSRFPAKQGCEEGKTSFAIDDDVVAVAEPEQIYQWRQAEYRQLPTSTMEPNRAKMMNATNAARSRAPRKVEVRNLPSPSW